ncbi:hypothetical protein WJ972_26645 [Achromobacter insuavis]
MPELDLPIALDYDGTLEARLFDDIRLAVAPNIPAARIEPPRDLAGAAERQAAGEYAIWNTVHDLFITQVAAHAIAGLFRDDTDFQFALARQLGDDAAHAEFRWRVPPCCWVATPGRRSNRACAMPGTWSAASRCATGRTSWPGSSTTSTTSWRACS